MKHAINIYCCWWVQEPEFASAYYDGQLHKNRMWSLSSIGPHMLQKSGEPFRMARVWRSALHPRCYGFNLPVLVQPWWHEAELKLLQMLLIQIHAELSLISNVPLGDITISSCSSCLHSCLLRFANGNLALKLVLTVQPAKVLNPHLPSFWGTTLYFQSNIALYQNCSHGMKT